VSLGWYVLPEGVCTLGEGIVCSPKLGVAPQMDVWRNVLAGLVRSCCEHAAAVCEACRRRRLQGNGSFVSWALGGFGNHRRSSAPQDAEAAMPENTKLLLKRIRSQAAEFRLLHHTVSAARMLVDTGGS